MPLPSFGMAVGRLRCSPEGFPAIRVCGIPFGKGSILFVDAFRVLDEIGYTWNDVTELRTDGQKDVRAMVENARGRIFKWASEAGLFKSRTRLLNA